MREGSERVCCLETEYAASMLLVLVPDVDQGSEDADLKDIDVLLDAEYMLKDGQ